MANSLFVTVTKFVSLEIDGSESETTYGIRVADDNDNTYCNTFDRDSVVGKSAAEIVAMARDIDDRSRDMVDFAKEALPGVNVGNAFFAWDELDLSAPKP